MAIEVYLSGPCLQSSGTPIDPRRTYKALDNVKPLEA